MKVLSEMSPASGAASAVEHYFTVDVEEYFQVSAFEPYVRREQWGSLTSRLESQLDYLLDLLARHGSWGTFFTLGWVARKYPALVRRIVDAGHELASHGDWHRRVTTMTPGEFREDLRASKHTLEDVGGTAVLGFRAPSFSIVPGLEWALETLVEEGFSYDSSLFPVRRRGYGYPSAPLVPYLHSLSGGRLILELPLTMARVGPWRIPASGGGWFRQFPYGVTRYAFQQRRAEHVPAVFYIHPWEVDPHQPRIDCPPLTRIRHYRGINVTCARLEQLFTDFRFTSVARAFGDHLRDPASLAASSLLHAMP